MFSYFELDKKNCLGLHELGTGHFKMDVSKLDLPRAVVRIIEQLNQEKVNLKILYI